MTTMRSNNDDVVKNTQIEVDHNSVVVTMGRVGRGFRKRRFAPTEAEYVAHRLLAGAALVRLRMAEVARENPLV